MRGEYGESIIRRKHETFPSLRCYIFMKTILLGQKMLWELAGKGSPVEIFQGYGNAKEKISFSPYAKASYYCTVVATNILQHKTGNLFFIHPSDFEK
jgi:hypothetical protein